MNVGDILANGANEVVVAAVGGIVAVIGIKGKKIQKWLKKRNNVNRYYKDVINDPILVRDEIYIDAYSVKPPETKILNTIEQWSKEEKSGVILIHGEPGHGKTTLCRKAVYEYYSKRFCKDKTNVFWFRLNPAFAEGIIENGKVVLKNAFCWGDPEIGLNEIRLEENEKEYQNSIVFLDGYDELKVQLHRNDLNLANFIDSAEQLARLYNIHIVITTRTRSLNDEFVSSSIKKLQFAPMSEEQQNKWIEKNAPGYKEDFEVLRASSEEMKEMLGIPILFRMVVEAQLKSTAAKNVVDLYDTLFEATMLRRKMKGRNIEGWHKEYEQLAYEIYCNDETFANMRGKELPEDFLYLFYLKGNGEKRVEFLHRSFYQYFLAYFLYRKMSEIDNEENAEAFLRCLAERRIDDDVLNYIQQIQEKKPDITQKECEQIINTLEQSDVTGQALNILGENENIAEYLDLRLHCENILTNALSICCTIATVEENEFTTSLCKKENIHTAMRGHNCDYIQLGHANLKGANLSGAILNQANLVDTDLIRADLIEAKLIGAKLIGAKLIGASLDGTDLSGADLSGANLRGADLIEADLRWAMGLESCHIEDAKEWDGCKILLRDRGNLGLEDPDAHGIIWCDDETGEPIEFHDYDFAWYDDETDDPIEP